MMVLGHLLPPWFGIGQAPLIVGYRVILAKVSLDLSGLQVSTPTPVQLRMSPGLRRALNAARASSVAPCRMPCGVKLNPPGRRPPGSPVAWLRITSSMSILRWYEGNSSASRSATAICGTKLTTANPSLSNVAQEDGARWMRFDMIGRMLLMLNRQGNKSPFQP